MRHGGYRADNAVGGVFFEHDALVAAVRIGAYPFYPGHELDDFELADFVGEAPYFRLVVLEGAPFPRLRRDHGLDYVDNLLARLEAARLELLEAVVRRRGGRGDVVEYAFA